MSTTMQLYFAGFSPAKNIEVKDPNTLLVISAVDEPSADVLVHRDEANQIIKITDYSNVKDEPSAMEKIFSEEDFQATVYEFDINKLTSLIEDEDPEIFNLLYELIDNFDLVISTDEVLFTLRALSNEFPLSVVIRNLTNWISEDLEELFDCKDDFSIIQLYKEKNSPIFEDFDN